MFASLQLPASGFQPFGWELAAGSWKLGDQREPI